MTTEKMTIHKALSELKIIDSRIVKAVGDATFCVANKNSNIKIRGISIPEFVAGMQSDYTRITDLIKRRDAIKRAVVLSNATVSVKVGGREYTVAEAIEMKQHGMALKDLLMQEMIKQYKRAQTEIVKNNGDDLEKRAEQYVVGIYGSREGRVDTADFEKAKRDFVESNSLSLIDPLKIKAAIDALEKEISEFTSEVDGALSTSNALTTIEVSY